MHIRLFQLLVPLLAGILVWSIVSRYRSGKLTTKEAIASSLFWSGVGVFAVFPDVISNFVAELFGFKSNVNAVIFLSLGIILFMLFRLYGIIREQRKAITELTRKLAIREFEKEPEE